MQLGLQSQTYTFSEERPNQLLTTSKLWANCCDVMAREWVYDNWGDLRMATTHQS